MIRPGWSMVVAAGLVLSWRPCGQLHTISCEVPAGLRMVDACSAGVVAALGLLIETFLLYVDVLLDYAMRWNMVSFKGKCFELSCHTSGTHVRSPFVSRTMRASDVRSNTMQKRGEVSVVAFNVVVVAVPRAISALKAVELSPAIPSGTWKRSTSVMTMWSGLMQVKQQLEPRKRKRMRYPRRQFGRK